jgi:hypothetical protein
VKGQRIISFPQEEQSSLFRTFFFPFTLTEGNAGMVHITIPAHLSPFSNFRYIDE